MQDLISRQAAIDVIEGRNMVKPSISSLLFKTNYEGMGEQDKEEFERDFDEILDLALIGLKHKRDYFMPPAQPERKTGHWIKTARWGRVYYCDQCRNYLDFDGVNVGRGSANFCPNCGADMRGEQDG